METVRTAAKERQRKGGKAKGCQTIDKPNAAKDASLRTDTARAKMAGTNRQYIHDADTQIRQLVGYRTAGPISPPDAFSAFNGSSSRAGVATQQRAAGETRFRWEQPRLDIPTNRGTKAVR